MAGRVDVAGELVHRQQRGGVVAAVTFRRRHPVHVILEHVHCQRVTLGTARHVLQHSAHSTTSTTAAIGLFTPDALQHRTATQRSASGVNELKTDLTAAILSRDFVAQFYRATKSQV